VSTTIYRYGFFEADVSHMFLETLKPGMTFFDVGAHIGYFTCLASYLVGPQGQVHSFEPTPTTFEVLTANAREKSNIKLNNVAVFSSETQLTFKDFGITHSAYNSAAGAKLTDDKHLAASRSYQVRTTMLDEYAKSTGTKPDMIKIDAENAEFEILSGMRRLLREAKPVVTLEVDDTGKDPASGGSARVVQLLEEHGYTAFEWRDNRLQPHVKRKEYGYGNLLFRSVP
jgi:FkbM family methyltransferase